MSSPERSKHIKFFSSLMGIKKRVESLPLLVGSKAEVVKNTARKFLQAAASLGDSLKSKVETLTIRWLTIKKKARQGKSYIIAQVLSLENKVRRVFARILTISGIISGIILISLFAMGYTAVVDYYAGFGLVLLVDGEEVGFLHEEDQDLITGYLADLEAQAAENYEMDVTINESVEYVMDRRPQKHLDVAILMNDLQRRVSYSATGYRLLVDGNETVVLGSFADYEEVVEIIEAAYVSQNKNSTLLAVNIEEDVSCEPWAVVPEDIVSVEEATNILLTGTPRRETYLVSRGDSLWAIARSNDMSVSDLQGANPQLNGKDMIRPGDELNLIVSEPLVNISVVQEVTVTERISYTTKYTTDSSMWKYQTRVRKRGSAGEKEVDYRIVLQNGVEVDREKIAERIIREPVTQLIARGSANIPSFGTGRFRWPLASGRGTITSPYGWRWGRMHTGVDIASSAGTSILASDSGVVVFSGYRSSYGNLVIINHGNGYSTYYAHNSKNLVSEGDKVDKGKTIALMGRTGRATGNHLHFEIRYNGKHMDPMKHFRP